LLEKQCAVALIQEAIQSGARQKQACEVLGLSSRTYQRWIKAGVVSDGRITAKRPVPANKLSDDERQQMSMANKIDPVADNNFDPLKVKYCVL
jgi:putative transposase